MRRASIEEWNKVLGKVGPRLSALTFVPHASDTPVAAMTEAILAFLAVCSAMIVVVRI